MGAEGRVRMRARLRAMQRTPPKVTLESHLAGTAPVSVLNMCIMLLDSHEPVAFAVSCCRPLSASWSRAQKRLRWQDLTTG